MIYFYKNIYIYLVGVLLYIDLTETRVNVLTKSIIHLNIVNSNMLINMEIRKKY